MAYYREIPLSKPEIDAVSKLISDVLLADKVIAARSGNFPLTTANTRFYLRTLLQKLDASE